MQFKIFWALPFLVLFSTSNFGWIDISWLIETLQIYKMHQNTISNNFQKCPKLCGTFLTFHSHFTRYVRKEKCLLRDSLKFIFSRGFHRDQGDHICFFLKAFPSKLIECVRIKHAGDFFCCPPSSRAAMKRLQSRDNSLLWEKELFQSVIILSSITVFPYHAVELLCPSFSALSSSSRNL